MTQPTVFLYSGQGSHYYQMGRDLFERNATFRRVMLWLDDMAVSLAGESALAEIYNPAKKLSDRFDRTRITHPAIFMIEYALTQVLFEASIFPSWIVASSLGNFAAAAAAGCLPVEDALRAAIAQAEIFEKHCPAGGMTAIFERSKEWVAAFARDHGCEIASTSDCSPPVIAATGDLLARAEAALRSAGAAFERLAVSFAFHSRWIDAAEQPFREFLAKLPFQKPRIPILCCDGSENPEYLHDGFLWDAGRKQILIDPTLSRLPAFGHFVDLGPSGSLATAVKYWLQGRGAKGQTHSIVTRFGRDAARLDQVIAALSAS